MKAGKAKLNRIAVICALLHYLLSFWTDRFIFRYIVFDFSDRLNSLKSLETVGVKLLFLPLLLFLWQGLFWLVRKADKRFLCMAAGYFLINVLLLLLIWPGIWRMDEFGILSAATYLYPNFWQNYLTSVFYIFSLMLFPFPAGVILVQCGVISLLAARVVFILAELFGGLWKTVENSVLELAENSTTAGTDRIGRSLQKSCKNAGLFPKRVIILIIPLVMFPVLDSNLYPMRMSLWAFLELKVHAELLYLEKKARLGGKREKRGDFASFPAKSGSDPAGELSDDFSTTSVLNCGKTGAGMVVLCVAAAVMTVWRTEAIYYLLLFPILLLLIALREQKNTDRSDGTSAAAARAFRAARPAILLYLICFVILFVPQKIGERLTSGQQYELTGMVLPLARLVAAADPADPRDAALLSDVDRVIDVELTREGVAAGKTGINLFWGEPAFQRTYDTAAFSACKKAYYGLILRYPGVFLAERVQTFFESSDLLMDTTKLFSDDENANYTEFRRYPLSAPLSEGLRGRMISLLELRSMADYDRKLWFTDFVYSAILPLLFLLAVMVFCIAAKRSFEAAVLLTAALKAPLIFLTAPSRLFMYYYPVYLVGLFALCCLILTAIQKGGKRAAAD